MSRAPGHPTAPTTGQGPVRRRRHAALGAIVLFAAVVLGAGGMPGAQAAGTAYAVLPPTVKVRPTDAVTGTASAQLLGARNEFVSFQLVFNGGSTGIGTLSVGLGRALTGPAGSIPAGNVVVYQEGYYTATKASTAAGGTGQWPDVLIPTVDPTYHEARRAFQGGVPAGHNVTAFVDILIPQTQAPGGYDGTITMTTDGVQTAVPVHLDVRAFTLPSTPSTRSLFKINWNGPCLALHPGCTFADEAQAWQSNYDVARLALDDRISIADPQYQPPTDATEQAFTRQYVDPLANGTAGTRLPGAHLTSLAVDTANAGQVEAWKAAATAGGYSGLAVSYDGRCDEPGSDGTRWAACRNVVPTIRAAWPGLPNVVTTTITEATSAAGTDLVDIIAPVIDHLDGKPGSGFEGNQRPAYNGFLAQPGKLLWLYTSCDVSGCTDAGETDPYFHGWVDYTIDTQASQNRAMGWMLYEYQASGELYYDTDRMMATAWNDQWASGGNGDGTLFYPGTIDRIGGSHAVPLDTLRLKLIRDGQQDYEYLKLATDAGHGAQAMQIARNLYPSTHDTAVPADAIENARRQLADLIAPATPQYAASRITTPVTVDGRLGDLAGGAHINLTGSNDHASVTLRWNPSTLYAGYHVTDAVLHTNQGGRDGEVWNGDGIELMIHRGGVRASTPGRTDYHLLVNINGDLTDERGTGSGWDRSWTANATKAIRRTTGGYDIELAVPWQQIGGAPVSSATSGLDVAVNDSDSPGVTTSYDWARLTVFAQPNRWGTLRLGPQP